MNRPGLLVEDLDVSWQPYFDRHVFQISNLIPLN